MSSNVVLECRNVWEKVGSRVIIRDLTFQLREGDILGFIGANGAGKTTSIKLMLGLQAMNGGSIEIFGFDIKKNFEKAISHVGAIVENPDLYMYMSGYENLKIVSKIYGVTDTRLNQVVKMVGLEDRIHDKVKKYSLGMRQRLGIAQAILHQPKVLILDEPMNGLDPEGMDEFKKLLSYLAYEEKMAILISSHILSELESFCTRVCILANGTLIKDDTMESIRKVTDKGIYLVELSSVSLEHILYQYVVLDDHHIKVVTTKENLNNIIKTLLLNGVSIFEIKKETVSLEEVFLNMTKGDRHV